LRDCRSGIQKYFREKFVFQLAFLDWKQGLALKSLKWGPEHLQNLLVSNYVLIISKSIKPGLLETNILRGCKEIRILLDSNLLFFKTLEAIFSLKSSY